MKQFHNIKGRAGVHRERAKSKRCVLRCFFKVATEMVEGTDSGKLFQRHGEQESKARACIGLDPRDRQTIPFV